MTQQRIFNRIKEVTLEYIKLTIEAYGQAIIHGDGNIYVDVEGEEPKQQRSYIAKTYAGVGNDAATYRKKFTSADQVPETVEELEKILIDAKAQEAFDDGKAISKDTFKSIGAVLGAAKGSAPNKELEAAEAAKLEAEQKAEQAIADADASKQAAEAAKLEAQNVVSDAAKAIENAKLEAQIQAEENEKLKKQIEKLQAASEKNEKK